MSSTGNTFLPPQAREFITTEDWIGKPLHALETETHFSKPLMRDIWWLVLEIALLLPQAATAAPDKPRRQNDTAKSENETIVGPRAHKSGPGSMS